VNVVGSANGPNRSCLTSREESPIIPLDRLTIFAAAIAEKFTASLYGDLLITFSHHLAQCNLCILNSADK
jgi:hypothetical protein